MLNASWAKGFSAAITVCDADGIILEMNDKACKVFAKYGGKALIGRNVLDCHPEPARSKLQEMLRTRKVNCYTIEKNGIKKLVYQAPWYEDAEYMGFVEVIIETPNEMPHHVR
ncbi:PAS domain-containing protein [Desulforudis sp. 1088]|uniref:PAS domain-containing protein n=1 Tax=unclassified Candidatus Desulforudis TaxID=2635950 RepID=UPI003CE5C037